MTYFTQNDPKCSPWVGHPRHQKRRPHEELGQRGHGQQNIVPQGHEVFSVEPLGRHIQHESLGGGGEAEAGSGGGGRGVTENEAGKPSKA